MKSTIYLPIRFKLWKDRHIKHLVIPKYMTEYGSSGALYELPDNIRRECQSDHPRLISYPTGFVNVVIDDVPVEVEYRELWPVAGSWFTPKAPFDYDIQKVIILNQVVTLQAKLVSAVKRQLELNIMEEA